MLDELKEEINLSELFLEIIAKEDTHLLKEFLDEIINPTGVAQNQPINFLITYLVHSPTVKTFDLVEYFDTFTSIMSFSMGRGLSTAYEIESYELCR